MGTYIAIDIEVVPLLWDSSHQRPPLLLGQKSDALRDSKKMEKQKNHIVEMVPKSNGEIVKYY